MAGRSSVEVFKKLEINTIGDLAHADVNVITLHLKVMDGCSGILQMELETIRYSMNRKRQRE